MTAIETKALRISGAAPPARTPPPKAKALDTSTRLSAKQRFALLEQFATLLDSGIQIAAALQSMGQQTRDPRIAAVLKALERVIVSGQSLSTAMESLPKAFPPLLVQMVRAGEVGGSLGDTVRRTVEAMELEATLRSKLRSAMIYPCVMLVLTCAVVAFLLTFVVPKFERMLRGKELPAPTKLLMQLGELASAYGVHALVLGIVAAAATVVFLRTARGIRVLDRLLLATPIVGSLYRTAIMARTARTLGLLVESGVSVHVAIEHARDVAQSPSYAALWQRARGHVINGGSLAEGLHGHALVDPTFEQIVATGEATAKLDVVMQKTAGQYTRELERRIRDLVTLVEPLMVVAMGGIVGFIALSIMLPIFRMSRA